VVVFLKARVVDKIAGRDDEVGRRREAVELAYTCSKRRGRIDAGRRERHAA
jgi:hypothetical protein